MREKSVNFDRAADFYDETRGFPAGIETQVAKFIVEIGQLNRTHTVLEIGVGTGRIALPLSNMVGHYYGIDISEGMLNKLVEKRENQPLYVGLADAEKLPFSDNTFDAIVIVHVLHLVREPAKVATELARVLKSNGHILNGFGGYSDGLKPIQDAWNQSTEKYRAKRPVFNRYDILPNLGWKQIDDIHTMTYSTTQSPRYFLEQVKNRSWSSTWDMTEEDINYAVEQIEAVIESHYAGNPDIKIASERSFNLQILQSP